MTRQVHDRNGRNRLFPALAGLFLLAWLVAVFFAVRDTFIHDRSSREPAEGGVALAVSDSGKGRFPILDRAGRELAVSFSSKSLYARPLEVEHPDAVALFLARELDLPERELKKDLKEERGFVWLGRQISETAVNHIRERKLRGIYVVDESQRFYPQGGMAAQLLGVAREGRGLTGIEAQYDQQLQTVVDLPDEKEQPRGPLVLTIDLRIQELVEQELAQLASETGATGGEGIVLDPHSGEVLALVNRPAFEPNFFGDSDENSRTNRVLSLALPASGFGQLFRLAASPLPVQAEIPAVVTRPSSPRDRLAALKKELRKGSVSPGTFGGGSSRLLPFQGGYRSPGLAGLERVSEPPGFAAFMASLGVGRKVVMGLPVGSVDQAVVGDTQPTYRATGGELLVAIARLLSPDGALEPKLVAGVVEAQSGRVQTPAGLAGATALAPEPLQRVRDYLARLASGADGVVYLEELTEVPGPVAEATVAADAVGVEGGGRARGQVWEPGLGATVVSSGGRSEVAVSEGKNAEVVPASLATKDQLVSGREAARKERPRHFVSLLVAVPGGEQVSEVLLLMALEGAVLDPAGPSPVRLAAERMLPQIRIWAAEDAVSPASLAWSANEALWRTQWRKAQTDRDARLGLTSRSNHRQMPDLQGASLRKAMQVLNQYGLKVRVQGMGRVVGQRPEAGAVISGDECLLSLSGVNLIKERPSPPLAVAEENDAAPVKPFSSISSPRAVAVGGN